MISRRWYAPAVLALLAAGAVMFFAGSRDWATGRVRAEGLPSATVAVTGSDVLPLATALALVVAAGGLAVLATRGRLRQLVGLIVLAAALGAVVTVATGSGAIDRGFTDAVEQSTAFTGRNAPDPQHTSWRWVLLGAGLVAAALGVLTVVSSRTWPSMGRRYDAPSAPRVAAVDLEHASGADVWKALDEGRDPTV